MISNEEQHNAQGVNLVFFIPTAIASIVVNLKNKNIKRNTAIIVIISGIIGAIIGSMISFRVNVKILRKLFGVFLIIIAIWEIFELIKSYIKSKKDNNKNMKI